MPDSSVLTLDASLAIRRVNAHHWPTRRRALRRARRRLRPGEAALIGRHREGLAGEVLQIGATGDRLTAALAHQADALTGIAISTPTVALCRELHPAARFLEANLPDLSCFADGAFGAVVAGHYALDLLPDAQRRAMLDEIRRVLRPRGLLIFSSHNLACESLIPPPLRHALTRPGGLGRLPRRLANHAQLRGLQQREHGFAVLNDATAGHGLLQYYVSRDHQERQLFEHDFALLECVTAADESVPRGELAYPRRELYFAARAFAPLD